jgi:tetratricopeptide (TPR) repeat protein
LASKARAIVEAQAIVENRSKTPSIISGVLGHLGVRRQPRSANEAEQALALLDRAHQLYECDPFIALNLGLACGRAGQYERASSLLLRSAAFIPIQYIKWCLVNAGLMAVERAQLDDAMKLLDQAWIYIKMENPQEDTFDYWSLPGKTTWVSADGAIEERLGSALALIERATEEYARRAPVPDAVLRLRARYREAASRLGA